MQAENGDRKQLIASFFTFCTRALVMAAGLCAAVGWLTDPAGGQTMINVATPFHTVSESTHERMGVDFGFQLAGGRGPGSRIVGNLPGNILTPNLAFSQNSLGSTLPQFGNFNPNAQATFGFNVLDGGNRLSLGFQFGQGSSRTMTSHVPSVTMFNGASGSITDATLRPFVTGLVPVVGYQTFGQWPPRRQMNHFSSGGNRYRQLLQNAPPSLAGFADHELHPSTPAEPTVSSQPPPSTAALGAASVREIEARREQELRREQQQQLAAIQSELAKARQFEQTGKIEKALAYYRLALQKLKREPAFRKLYQQTFELYSRLID